MSVSYTHLDVYKRQVLISIDQDGNYECTVEEPLELDAMPLDDLLTEGDK